MATIKSHTDLEQSRKLAEILPIESADMQWIKMSEDGDPDAYRVGVLANPELIDEDDIPSWSLSALLSVLPNLIGDCFKTISCLYGWHCAYMNSNGEIMNNDTKADNPIDACYEMILKLHELKLL